MVKKLTGLLVVLMLMMGVGSAAFASTTGTTKASVTIKSGPLNIVSPSVSNSFQPVSLNGGIQTVNADLSSFDLKDATGSGDGWHVTAQATQMSDNAGHKLPSGSMMLKSPNKVVDEVNSSSALPSILDGNYAIDSQGATILSAEKSQGMGTYKVSFPTNTLSLTLNPGTTYVDTDSGSTNYASTITWTIVSGP